AAQYVSSSFTDNDYFDLGNYTQVNQVPDGRRVNFRYTRTGTVKTMSVDTWEIIFQLAVWYTADPAKKTTFYWTNSEDFYYSVEVLVGAIPIPISGGKIDIPAELTDRSLPVQMASFVGRFDYSEGIHLNWTTQSETDCAGFQVFRSEQESGPFSKISTTMIKASGNSSSRHEYGFVDKNVNGGRKYWYKLQEISSFPGLWNETYYGLLAVEALNPPDRFALRQNFPNPFNPETRISYDLPESGNVTLAVYDILGKEVRRLIQSQKNAGSYEEVWDGRDSAGRMLPSGMYFYKLTAGDNVSIRKMMKLH
ncbi:MAG TPA: T9SS type A sorting domain-containing protein, partial [bacterium]